MKKKIFVATAAFLMTLTATFAQDNNPVPDAIVKVLHQDFKNESNVHWKTTANYYKASFTVDGQSIEAFYDFDGKRIGVSRFLHVEQLPMSLVKEVKDKEAFYTLSELFELLTDRGTEYFITYKNDKETKTYKSDGNSWWLY